MKRLVVMWILVCMLLPVASAPVYASESVEVSAEIDYWFQPTAIRQAGPNMFMDAVEQEVYRGDMEGTGNSVFTVGMFRDFWTVWLRSEFEGVIDGREGTLVMQLVGKKPVGEDWYGTWVIISGTGELANAHGEGSWWGPGYRSDEKTPGDPDCYTLGLIHFDP
jgi:hypothetical protein